MNIEKSNHLFKISEEKETPSSLEKFPKPEEYLQIMKELGFPEHAKAYEKVLELAEIVKNNGGQALLVGGSVRDSLMGKISKDFDMEIYGLESDKVEKNVQQIG